MAEKKRKKLTNQEWCDLMNRIHTKGSCLTLEAQKLKISLKELIAMGDEAHKGKGNEQEKEWRQTKRESSKKDKQIARPRKMRKPATTSVPAPTSAPTPAPAARDQTLDTPVAPMEELLRKKEKLQKEVTSCAASLEEVNAILDIRQGTLSDAKAVLEKAKQAVQKAEADEVEAKTAVQQAKEQQATAQAELQQVEQKIQKLREKTIYLVDPWYTGEFPEYGTFISTVEMEGVTLEEVPEEYLPGKTLEGVLLFDFIPDYKKARIFCGLVAKYELDETPYHILVSDERLKELLKMYIG